MSRYGIPDKVLSDSGSQYTSREFINFAKEYELKHVTSPYHHPSNLSLLSRKQRRFSKRLQRAEVTLTWRCWLIVTPQQGFGTSPPQRVCKAEELKQTFLLIATC